jgi:hypothetical protein
MKCQAPPTLIKNELKNQKRIGLSSWNLQTYDCTSRYSNLFVFCSTVPVSKKSNVLLTLGFLYCYVPIYIGIELLKNLLKVLVIGSPFENGFST